MNKHNLPLICRWCDEKLETDESLINYPCLSAYSRYHGSNGKVYPVDDETELVYFTNIFENNYYCKLDPRFANRRENDEDTDTPEIDEETEKREVDKKVVNRVSKVQEDLKEEILKEMDKIIMD